MKTSQPIDPAARRRAAEAQQQKKSAPLKPQTEADLRRIQHELEVHQIELEMQNDELRSAHAEIEAGLERYTDLFDFAPAGYFNLNAEGLIQLVNLTGASFVGLERARLRGRRFASLVAEEDRRRFGALLARVFATEGRQTGELTLATEGRPALFVRLEATLSPDGQECRLAVLDLTERRAAEEALRASEERYRALFEYAPDGIIISERGKYFLDANPSICRMLGYTHEEMVGLSATDLIVPAEHGRIEAARKAVQAGLDHHQEWLLRRKDGSIFPAEGLATLLPDGNFLSMIRDVTQRKKAAARLHRLVESNAQGVFFWNKHGSILEGNDAFLRIVGATREDLVSGRLNWIALTPPEYADRDLRALEELAATGVCTPFEKEYLREDETRVPILLGAATFDDDPDEGVCFVLDLTERKSLEQQFLRSQRMEGIGTLAGGIAHDLNNVLGPIIMALDLFKLKFTDPASQELLDIISSSAQHGANMVRQVLSFARGIEGRRMVVQVSYLLQDIEKIAHDTFRKNITVQTNVPNDLWPVLGDPTQLHQVLLNLAVNARDALPEGGELTFSAENLRFDPHYAGLNLEAKAGPYVCIGVADTGIGMPPALLEKIFDPFFTTKEVGKGTGLGLSTTLSIVKSHAGFIRVQSAPGEGTKFQIFLPAHPETSVAALESVAASPRGKGELILVVDDEVSVRRITQQTLETFGYRVVLAADGADAVAVYARRGGEIAVVLTDMTMPVMDGPATIRVLLKMNPAVQIIGVSGLAASEDMATLAGLGVKHFLPKPYTTATLLQVLQEVLSTVD